MRKRIMQALILILLPALLLTSLVVVTLAAPGSLDATFGSSGVVTTDFGSSDDRGQAVALQSDGKIVVAGYNGNVNNHDFALARYTITGSLDATFGSSGVVTTDFGGSDDRGYAVALQSDGKIVVAGYNGNGSNWDFALARYTITGSLDATFGSSGVVTTDFGGSNDFGEALALQSDGKLVVAGLSYTGSNTAFALARYTITGSLDTTFGHGGIVTTSFGISDDRGQAVALQSDGKIVVAGDSWNGSNTDFALARYTITGSLDTTFGSSGVVTTDFDDSEDFGNALALQSDGKIVVAGAGDWVFALARYTGNGSLDTTFGAGGKVTTPIGGDDDYGQAVALQSGGKIVIAGESLNNSSNYDFALARYTGNGSLDTTFGSNGIVTTGFGDSEDSGSALALQSDGKLVVAGSSDNGSGTDFALARYEGDRLTYLPLILKNATP